MPWRARRPSPRSALRCGRTADAPPRLTPPRPLLLPPLLFPLLQLFPLLLHPLLFLLQLLLQLLPQLLLLPQTRRTWERSPAERPRRAWREPAEKGRLRQLRWRLLLLRLPLLLRQQLLLLLLLLRRLQQRLPTAVPRRWIRREGERGKRGERERGDGEREFFVFEKTFILFFFAI